MESENIHSKPEKHPYQARKKEEKRTTWWLLLVPLVTCYGSIIIYTIDYATFAALFVLFLIVVIAALLMWFVVFWEKPSIR